jgi:hypothetical protein
MEVQSVQFRIENLDCHFTSSDVKTFFASANLLID